MTSPAVLSTRRCCDTAGLLTGSSLANSTTARGRSTMSSKIALRVESPSAVHASVRSASINGKATRTVSRWQPMSVRSDREFASDRIGEEAASEGELDAAVDDLYAVARDLVLERPRSPRVQRRKLQALTKSQTKHHLLERALLGGEDLATRDRRLAPAQPLGIFGGSPDVPPAHAIKVRMRAGPPPPPVERPPVADVVMTTRLVVL